MTMADSKRSIEYGESMIYYGVIERKTVLQVTIIFGSILRFKHIKKMKHYSLQRETLLSALVFDLVRNSTYPEVRLCTKTYVYDRVAIRRAITINVLINL